MKSKTYRSNHALKILSMLNKDRIKMKNYCDVTLTGGSTDFAGHKCILGVFTKFFYKMFSIEMKENYESKGNIQGVTEETLEAVLNFIYTCAITITTENVYDLIEAANYMGIPYLKEFCVEFLLKQIDVTNCLRIRSYSKLYNLDKLEEGASLVITNNFESVIKDAKFHDLRFEDIKEIFEMEDKQVTSEEIVYNGMIQWIKHDVDARKKHLTELFSLLKLKTLPGVFLQNVVSQEGLIMNNIECLKKCFELTLSRSTNQQDTYQAVVRQQKPINYFLGFASKFITRYDITKKEKTDDLPGTWCDHSEGSVVSYQNKVYVISGKNTDTVERLDFDIGLRWTRLASANTMRRDGASVVFNDCIYNYGGLNAPQSGECYNIHENRWNKNDDMNEKRSFFTLVSSHRGIYSLGGSNNRYLNSVGYHDPRQGGWTNIPSMKSARQGLAGVFLDDQLYAIGGWNNSGNLKIVERFDPWNQTWCNVTEMNHARCFHGACVINGKIYVVGGGSDVVEVYDPKKNFGKFRKKLPSSKMFSL